MPLFLTDPIVIRQDTLGCLIPDKQADFKSLPPDFEIHDQGGNLKDAAFTLIGTPFDRQGGSPDYRPLDMRDRLRFWSAVVSTKNLAAGFYTALSISRGSVTGLSEFAVIDESLNAKALSELATHPPTSVSEPTDTDDVWAVKTSWRRAWKKHQAYAESTVTDRYIERQEDVQLTPSHAVGLSRSTLDWVNFHLIRFVYREVFHGGRVRFSMRTQPNEIIQTIQISSAMPTSAKVDAVLGALLEALRADKVIVSTGYDSRGYDATLTCRIRW